MQSFSDERPQKDWAIVLVESPNQASDDHPTLGDCPAEANPPSEEGVLAASPLDVEEVRVDASLKVVTAPTPSPKSIDTGPRKKRLPD